MSILRSLAAAFALPARRTARILGLLLVLVVGASSLAAPGRQAAASPTCEATWKESRGPTVVGGGRAVAVLGRNDVWVVGPGANTKHFDGRRWSAWPVGARAELFDVAGTGASDVWAVGMTRTDVAMRSRPLIAHWNGKRWTTVPGPRVAATQLYGVSALGVRDALVVGGTLTSAHDWEAFAAHWDGRSWKTTPVVGSPLVALATFSARDVWAVGWSDSEGRYEGIARWDGRYWVPPPAGQRFREGSHTNWYPSLADIDGRSSTDLWVVGSAAAGPLVQRLTGNTVLLREVPIPFAHFQRNYDAHTDSTLNGVAVLAPNNVWAVGNFGIEHWTGKRWQRLQAFRNETLTGIAARSANDIWAVGDEVILHYSCGASP